jgi:hypothetical protein
MAFRTAFEAVDRLRIRTGVQRRTIDRFDGFEAFKARLACFEGSGWIQSVVGVNLSSKRAEIGLERRRDRQNACRLPTVLVRLLRWLVRLQKDLEWLRNDRELLQKQGETEE